jgi:hypothetical protein
MYKSFKEILAIGAIGINIITPVVKAQVSQENSNNSLQKIIDEIKVKQNNLKINNEEWKVVKAKYKQVLENPEVLKNVISETASDLNKKTVNINLSSIKVQEERKKLDKFLKEVKENLTLLIRDQKLIIDRYKIKISQTDIDKISVINQFENTIKIAKENIIKFNKDLSSLDLEISKNKLYYENPILGIADNENTPSIDLETFKPNKLAEIEDEKINDVLKLNNTIQSQDQIKTPEKQVKLAKDDTVKLTEENINIASWVTASLLAIILYKTAYTTIKKK